MSDTSGSVSIVAVDTGGTFTDVVVLRDGRLSSLKVPSTPDDPARAVLDGLRAALGREAPPFVLVHGSTVATNALLERKGARVFLITNRGFEDLLEIGRQDRPLLYALAGRRAPPLVAAADRHGIRGRIGPEGEVIEPLDETELERLPGRIRGADAVAVCLLHSYANPGHEERVAAALATCGVPVSASAAVLREYREYERMSTTVVNAYVAPRMERYLGRLAERSGAARFRVMGSGGGALPVARAREQPVLTVLSGPAGGVAGALASAGSAGIEHIIAFDMGGTSTDVSLCPGRPLHTREFTIAGVPVATPVLDIHTVGAGGGSIARIDPGGSLRVGPASAGADPGPICYGRSGRDLTVTDANVWLGRLPADAFLGGERALDRELIAEPLLEIARRLGTSREEAAEGVLAVADTAMEGALRVISVERGHDPAGFTLVPFGGAAGLHAISLADRLGIPRLLVPPDPGVLSALGMLVSPVRKDASRTVLVAGGEAGAGRLETEFNALETEAAAAMAEEGIARAHLTIARSVDARYRGQSYELRVPAAKWVADFHAAHELRFGYARPEGEVEAVTLRVEATAPAPRIPARELDVAAEPAAAPAAATRVFHGGGWIRANRFDRRTLLAGHQLTGPAIVTEYSATTWLPPDWTAEVLPDGALLVQREAHGASRSRRSAS